MDIDIVLDTNIIIYILKQDKKYVDFLEQLENKRIGISVVSYMEIMVGINSEVEAKAAASILMQMDIIPLYTDIATQVADILRKRAKRSLKDPKLADTIIAQTALALSVPLVTNNAKDFSRFQNLTLVVP